MSEKQRQPVRIREERDFHAAILELRTLCDLPTQTSEEQARTGELNRAVELFLQYCPGNSTRPRPHRLLCYLMDHVKPGTTADVARETGIADLRDVLGRKRELTGGEVAALSRYFGVSPGALELTAEDRDRDREERTRGW